MKSKLLLPLFLLSLATIGKAQVNQGDSLALVEFYNNTQPKSGHWTHHENWLTAAPLNDWFGIKVVNNRVTEVGLGVNNIRGKMPASFMNLTGLKRLVLRYNTYLSIVLTPDIAKLKSLVSMDLQSTNTTGSLPEEITQLKYLNTLILNDCSLSGTLPNSIGKLTKLSNLQLVRCGLGGTVPQSFGNLAALQSVYLDNNNFSGALPANGYLPSLIRFSVFDNHFSGPLPAWLSSSTSVEQLVFAANEFTGGIPAAWDSLNALTYLQCGGNHLTGPIPEWLLTAPKIEVLYVDDNEFSRADNPCTVLSPSLLEYSLARNRYNFNGLECIVPYDDDRLGPQAQLAIGKRGNKLTVSAGGTLSNNTYYWYKVGSAQSKVITGDSTFLPPQSGQYYALVQNNKARTLELHTDTVTYTKAAAVSEINITLSPNPTRGQITVYGLNDKADAMVRITDLSGNVWLQANSRKRRQLLLNAVNLKPGNYFVVVTDGVTIKTVPFVKN